MSAKFIKVDEHLLNVTEISHAESHDEKSTQVVMKNGDNLLIMEPFGEFADIMEEVLNPPPSREDWAL